MYILIMHNTPSCVGQSGHTFHSAFDIFQEFFGGEDPFASMFGGAMFSDFGSFGGWFITCVSVCVVEWV